MQVKVIAAFNDMSNADPDTRRREIGDQFDVEDARGAELAALRLVEPSGATDPEAIPLPGGITMRLGATGTGPLVADPAAPLTPSTPTAPVVAQP